MKHNPLFAMLILVVVLSIFPLPVSAEISNLGYFKYQRDNVELLQAGNNITAFLTYCNISSVKKPDSTILISNVAMTKRYSDFNYTLLNTSLTQQGRYLVYGYCGDAASIRNFAYEFWITYTGNERINSGEGLSIAISVIVLIVIAAFLFLLSFVFQNPAGRIIFIGLGAIVLIMGILYSMVTLTQTIGSFSGIVEGFATFWFVMKILVGIAIIALLIFSLFLSYNYWMKKRGFRD